MQIPTTMGQILGAYAQPPAPTPQSMPDWIPPSAQAYIRSQPSYAEGQIQAPGQWSALDAARAQVPPNQPLNPQPDDVERLFQNQIIKNQIIPLNPTPPSQAFADFLRSGKALAGDSI
jgi:hypothetical protein